MTRSPTGSGLNRLGQLPLRLFRVRVRTLMIALVLVGVGLATWREVARLRRVSQAHRQKAVYHGDEVLRLGAWTRIATRDAIRAEDEARLWRRYQVPRTVHPLTRKKFDDLENMRNTLFTSKLFQIDGGQDFFLWYCRAYEDQAEMLESAARGNPEVAVQVARQTAYHAALKRKYQHAASHPWEEVAADPPIPVWPWRKP